MSNIATKLTYLNGTKQAIKQAINEDFEVIDNNTIFREYADEISSNNAKYKDLIPKVNVNATNTLDISNSSGLDKALVTQYGNTYQETTTGKNIFNQDTISSIGSEGGTYSNGVITTNQVTSSGTSNFVVYFYNKPVTLTPNTYYLSMDIRIKSGTGSFNKTNDGTKDWTAVSKPTLSTTYQRYVYKYTYTSNTTFDRMLIQFTNSTNAIYEITNIMLSTSSDTNFEKFTGGNPAPNPDYPQEIVNISGKSTLKDVGKNLFDKDNTNIINAYINISVLKAAGESGGSFYIPCEPNTTYTVSKTELFGNDRFCVFDTYRIPTAGDTILSYVGKPTGDNSDTSLTITTNATATYLGIFVKAGETSPAKTFQEIADTIQVEKNPTATEYEEFKEQSFDLDLKSRNLCNGINQNYFLNNAVSKCGYFSGNNGLIIEIDGISNYTVSSIITQERYRVACLNEIPTDSAGVSSYQGINKDNTNDNITINTTGYKYLVVNATDLTKIQIEENSTATEYEPFYDINLCKIDTYKDRIYPLNGKWYLEKKIGKVVLNGSEDWQSYINEYKHVLTFRFRFVDIKSVNQIYLLSNYFKNVTDDDAANGEFRNRYNNYYNLEFVYTDITSVPDFKTWLSTHNTIVYYILNTPTTEEITESNYPALYNQLNNIKLFEGVNHITMTNESGLDVEFDITYYKDWKLD